VKTLQGRNDGADDRSFFEPALALYSYFGNLLWGRPQPLYLLADPVDDDPSFSWDEYRGWYEETITAALFVPWVARYEVMPWPDRVFLPGHPMGGGTPGPMAYRKELLAVFRALDAQLPLAPEILQHGVRNAADALLRGPH